MNATYTGPLAALVSALVCGLLTAQAAVDPAVNQKLARMSVPFVPNHGQWDRQDAFAAQTFAGTLFVTSEGKLVYSLPGKPVADEVSTPAQQRPSSDERNTEHTPGWVLTETFVDAKRQAIIAAPTGYRPAAPASLVT